MRYPKCGYYIAEKDGNIIQGYDGYMCLPHEMCGGLMEPDEKHPYNIQVKCSEDSPTNAGVAFGILFVIIVVLLVGVISYKKSK